MIMQGFSFFCRWMFELFMFYFCLESVCISRYSCPLGAFDTAKGVFSLFMPLQGIHKLKGRAYVGLRGRNVWGNKNSK